MARISSVVPEAGMICVSKGVSTRPSLARTSIGPSGWPASRSTSAKAGNSPSRRRCLACARKAKNEHMARKRADRLVKEMT